MTYTVTFSTASGAAPIPVQAPEGALISEAAALAGLEIGQPCGGQGRCGRCAVQVISGTVRRRSMLRLSADEVTQGYALACQTVLQGDAAIFIPAQEKIERRLATDRVAREVSVPEGYAIDRTQTVRRYNLSITPPSLDDQTDDWSRLQTALKIQHSIGPVSASLSVLRRMGAALRAGDWQVCLVIEHPSLEDLSSGRIVAILPGSRLADSPLWAAAIDIGTTTVTFWLVDLLTGKVEAQAADYNGQIARGEDVISRIVAASREGGVDDLQTRVVETINRLSTAACLQAGADPLEICKATVAGNPTMIHLLLAIPADSVRLTPFVPAVNLPGAITAGELGLAFCPDALIDCLPGVASYVGADITAGVLSSGMADTDELTLFIDVGTNGEIVLGSREWLMTCACSAGPAFEGAGVKDGMRATAGAIDEVWVNADSGEAHIHTIGGGKPRGICGSGLIALVAELFLAGILDKGGNFNLQHSSERVRASAQGGEYVVAWGRESESGEDIVLTRVDVDNLMRAKAAIYAGFHVLADKVGLSLDDVQQMAIGGSFGKYINIEKAIQIGLLPDLAWEKFRFLGNTAIKGAYFVLLGEKERQTVRDDAVRMTYVELCADNSFYEAFTSALFLPHTDTSRFPSVEKLINQRSQS
jgi:uncharacterized 2Fe-2S/4Fe-4S cluster protein (DUF4445 family)